mmetsp:Transcript_14014/g.44237  ORF Transcript_14014/g.44237 Transcript_14014/m.44237 type:complete len:447 (+) Transcript_14014:64-1404(+)
MMKWVVLGLVARRSWGMVHSLRIEHDERSLYRIENFCFVEDGELTLSVSELQVSNGGTPRVGFVMRRSSSESAAQQELEELLEEGLCLLDKDSSSGGGYTAVSLEFARETSARLEHKFGADEEGLYSLVFARCEPKTASVSFRLEASFSNPGPSYLSACESQLPLLFAVFAACYLIETVAWFGLLVFGKLAVHYIHWMMGVLLVFKASALASQSMRYHFLDATGRGEGWQFVYYVFATLKGVTLFVVILLIGTGWSLVKPYLNDRDKYTILVVLCLQVVDNVALVAFEETAPGSQKWLDWRDLLHLVDILCCCAIIFPIVASIRHLRRAAAADGKTADNIRKLTLFRQFYVMVVSYLYFTRIVVYLLAAILPFRHLWLRYVFSEAATIAFYTVTGLKFRPQDDNPYLPLKRDDPDPLGPPPPDDDDDLLDAEYGDPPALAARPSAA